MAGEITDRWDALLLEAGLVEADALESVRDLRSAVREVTGGCRVLLVEDQSLVAKSLYRLLVRAGHTVDVAGTIAAVETLDGPWDVGIFDYLMPDGVTTSLAQGMSRSGEVTHVIVYTGVDDREDVVVSDHVLRKGDDSLEDVVALVGRLAKEKHP